MLKAARPLGATLSSSMHLLACWMVALAMFSAGCLAEPLEESDVGDEDVGAAEQPLWALRVSLPSQIRAYTSAPSEQCLGVAGASVSNNARVEQMPCSVTATSRWVAETTYAGTSLAVVTLRNVDTNKCLDAGTAQPQQFECHGGPAQQWRVLQNGRDVFGLHNDSRNRRLVTAQGHQWFYFEPSVPTTRGLEFRARSNGWCMDVPGFAQSTAIMQAYPCNGGTNQQFRLVPWGSDRNVFEMRPVHSGKCVEATFGSPPTTVGQFFVCDGYTLQHWTLFYDMAAGDYSVVLDTNWRSGIVASGYDLDMETPPGRWLVQ